MSVLAQEGRIIEEIDEAFLLGGPASYDKYLRDRYPKLFNAVENIIGPDPSGRDYFGSWPTPWPNPTGFTPEKLDWYYLDKPAGKLEDVEVFDSTEVESLAAEELSKPQGWLVRAKEKVKNSKLGRLGQKISERLSNHRTEAVAYCVGAAAFAGAGYSLAKGVADIHTFNSASEFFLKLLEINHAEMPLAQENANQHFAEAGVAGMVGLGAIGTGAVVGNLKADAGRETLSSELLKAYPYQVDRPKDFYTMTPQEQAMRTRAARSRAAVWRARAQGHFSKARTTTLYYANNYIPQVKSADVVETPAVEEITTTVNVDPDLSPASQALLDRFDAVLAGQRVAEQRLLALAA